MDKVWDIYIKHSGEINVPALDKEIRTALKGVIGISTGWYGVRVHLDHEPTETDVKAAETVVQKHDPTKLTAEQQAFEQWRADVEALSAKDWSALTPAERETALRLQHEQMIYQATGKLPPTGQ